MINIKDYYFKYWYGIIYHTKYGLLMFMFFGTRTQLTRVKLTPCFIGECLLSIKVPLQTKNWINLAKFLLLLHGQARSALLELSSVSKLNKCFNGISLVCWRCRLDPWDLTVVSYISFENADVVPVRCLKTASSYFVFQTWASGMICHMFCNSLTCLKFILP